VMELKQLKNEWKNLFTMWGLKTKGYCSVGMVCQADLLGMFPLLIKYTWITRTAGDHQKRFEL